MKFACLSDTHGKLPEIPECDAVLMAGDICAHGEYPQQLRWMNTTLRSWLVKVNKPVFACAGNHDWPMYEAPNDVLRLRLPWKYLQDDWVMHEGFKIYGTPWQKKFYDWAFNMEEHQLAGKWNMIPDDTDILVCHSPPKFYGDLNQQGEHCGSESLTWRIQQIKPKLVVFGHIHCARGEWRNAHTIMANVAVLNESYQLVHEPWIVELEDKK